MVIYLLKMVRSLLCSDYPLVICYIAIENGPFISIYSGFTHLEMVIFHSYVGFIHGLTMVYGRYNYR